MAKSKYIPKYQQTIDVYTPIKKLSDLYVGKEYFLKLESQSKYTKQIIRDRVPVNHKQGLHVGESIEEYGEYRDEMDLWCRKGRLYEKHTELLYDLNDKQVQTTKTCAIVSINSNAIFDSNENRDSLCLNSFQL